MKNPFPDFVSGLPIRDYGIEGLIVHGDKGECGETYFVYAEKEIAFPEHAHGARWTVALEGKRDFTAYYVCSVCGYLSEGPCDKCPACGASADKFKKVE